MGQHGLAIPLRFIASQLPKSLCEHSVGEKINPKEIELYRFIDEILINEWDPIGVSDIPEARDEYYAFIPQVFEKVINGESVQSIAKLLRNLETEELALLGANTDCKKIAEKIIEEKQRLGLG